MRSNLKTLAMAVTALVAIGSTTLVSCEKDSILTRESSVQKVDASVKGCSGSLNLNQNDRELFARSLATSFAKAPQSYSELNSAIHVVVGYGLDENLKLYDVLNTDNSVFLPSSCLVNTLRSAIEESIDLSAYGLMDNNYYGNLQLYWPYHDDWDTKTTPVICFAPEDENTESVTGYYYENGDIVSINVTAKSIDEELFPVIIINKSETYYGDYPDFKNDKWRKNGIVWGKPLPILTFKPIKDNSSTDNKVYEARSVSITSSGTQYDNIWAGGSEFELQSIYAVDASHTAVSSKARAEFSRKQIKNNETKNFGTQLHENWQSGLGHIHMRLTEKDDWGSVEPIVINLDVAGNTLSTTININSTDDVIFDSQYTRSNYFNRCNNHNGIFYLGTERVDCMLDIYDSYGD